MASIWFAHQRAGPVETGLALGKRDGMGFGAPTAEGGNGRGKDRRRNGVPDPAHCGCS